MAHKFPPNQYWWGPNYLPKSGTMLISGDSGIGKSWLVLSVIRALTLGEPVFGYPNFDVPRATKVLYMDQEVSPAGLQGRIGTGFTQAELSQTAELFYAISGHPEISFSEPEGFDLISNEVARVKPEVLILDPIANLHDWEENSNTDIGKLFRKIGTLLALGKPQGMAVIVIHHNGKPPNEKSDYDPLASRNIRGASKFKTVPDTILMLDKKKVLNKSHPAWKLKCRFDKSRQCAELPDFYLDFNKDGDTRVVFDKLEGESPFSGGVGIKPLETITPEGPKIKVFG